MKTIKNLIITTAITLTSISSYANDELQQEIESSMANGDVVQAYLIAKDGYGATNELNELFVLAQLAKKSGKLMAAQDYYEQMLAIKPDLSRVKLELADVNLSLGQAQRAKQLLTDVNAENLPPNVKANVEKYLNIIESGQYPKSSALSISMQSIYDSNVNSGPTIDTVTMYGLPFLLSDDAKQNSDLGYAITANYVHAHRLSDDTSINSNINAGYTGWSEFKQLNNLNLSAKTGVSHNLNAKQSVYLPLEVGKSFVDDKSNYTSYGISPSFTHRLSKTAYVNLTSVASRRDYNQSDKKADTYSANIRSGFQLSPTITANAQLTYGTEDYNSDNDDNTFYNIGTTLSKNLNDDLSAYMGASYSNVAYDKFSVVHQKVREDDNYSVRGGLSYNVGNNTSLIFDTSYSKNKSNIELNEYDRTRVSVGVNSTF